MALLRLLEFWRSPPLRLATVRRLPMARVLHITRHSDVGADCDYRTRRLVDVSGQQDNSVPIRRARRADLSQITSTDSVSLTRARAAFWSGLSSFILLGTPMTSLTPTSTSLRQVPFNFIHVA